MGAAKTRIIVYKEPGTPGVLGGRKRSEVGCETPQVPDGFSGSELDLL